jgi:chemotaxis protein CheD
MRELGATGPFIAKLAGGATLFGSLLTTARAVGARNVEASRAALARARVALVAEDVGGEGGRTVTFDVASGALKVKSVRGGERVL